ncbi:MAG: HAD family phosphatase [Lachnospiraceae bacterium]|nr:HAD family phosphatase [Lachnospiraceae bacterium]
MIRGAIFDIDGTMIDSMSIWDSCALRYLKTLGITGEENLGKILFPMTVEEGVRYCKERYQLTQSEEEIRRGMMKIIEDFYRYEVEIKSGVRECLDVLRQKGIRMVLATVGDVELEKAALVRLGIWDYFEKMFACEDYGTTKRESRIYQICAEYLGMKAEEVLVFEDVLTAVESAHRAGFPVVGVYDSASADDQSKIRENAVQYVRNLSEFSRDMLD